MRFSSARVSGVGTTCPLPPAIPPAAFFLALSCPTKFCTWLEFLTVNHVSLSMCMLTSTYPGMSFSALMTLCPPIPSFVMFVHGTSTSLIVVCSHLLFARLASSVVPTVSSRPGLHCTMYQRGAGRSSIRVCCVSSTGPCLTQSEPICWSPFQSTSDAFLLGSTGPSCMRSPSAAARPPLGPTHAPCAPLAPRAGVGAKARGEAAAAAVHAAAARIRGRSWVARMPCA
mmetsp:Transcript_6930/g.17211  ORF Transcript_6930/g.17211 Transcript_6930/m.17211 type:complete len:228 (+) Transcript_6930:900-1583(+)